METLEFNFGHPVKGVIKLLNNANPKQSHIMPLDTTPGQNASIPINDLCCGKWQATIEWEYDGRNYFYEEKFEVGAGEKAN